MAAKGTRIGGISATIEAISKNVFQKFIHADRRSAGGPRMPKIRGHVAVLSGGYAQASRSSGPEGAFGEHQCRRGHSQ